MKDWELLQCFEIRQCVNTQVGTSYSFLAYNHGSHGYIVLKAKQRRSIIHRKITMRQSSGGNADGCISINSMQFLLINLLHIITILQWCHTTNVIKESFAIDIKLFLDTLQLCIDSSIFSFKPNIFLDACIICKKMCSGKCQCREVNNYSQSICKLLYISDLQVKRQKSGDVNSEQIEKDEDLTHLTFVNYKKWINTAFCKS